MQVQDEWFVEGIPISNPTVTARYDRVKDEIEVVSRIAGKIKEQYIQCWNDQVRNALIDAGWTPPPEKNDGQ